MGITLVGGYSAYLISAKTDLEKYFMWEGGG